MLVWQLQTGKFDEFNLQRGIFIGGLLTAAYLYLTVAHPFNYTAMILLDGSMEGTYDTPLIIPHETDLWIQAANSVVWETPPSNASCFGDRIAVSSLPELNDEEFSRAHSLEDQLRSKVANSYVSRWLHPANEQVFFVHGAVFC